MGFDENACLALRRLNKVWGHGGHDIRLILHGIGQPGDFAECKLFGPAKDLAFIHTVCFNPARKDLP